MRSTDSGGSRSALSDFSDADTLRLESLEYQVDGPEQVAGPRHRPPLCVSKPAGDAGFTLSATDHLALYERHVIVVSFDDDSPSEQYENPDIQLHLVPDGPPVTLPGGRIRQAFTVTERPDIDIRYHGFDVHVDSITGRIVLDITERVPWAQTTGCDRELRYVRADVVSVPDESQLEVQGSAAGVGAALHVTSIALSGVAAAPGFQVGIHPHRDECGRVGVVPGGTQGFWASVGTPPPGGRAYAWTVQGATILGPANLPHVKVQLSAVPHPEPDPVHVQLRVDIGGLSASAGLDFRPDTPADSRSKSLRCAVQSHLRVNFLADPLWDPLRDFAARPLSRAEVARLRDAAAGLLDAVDRFLEHARE